MAIEDPTCMWQPQLSIVSYHAHLAGKITGKVSQFTAHAGVDNWTRQHLEPKD